MISINSNESNEVCSLICASELLTLSILAMDKWYDVNDTTPTFSLIADIIEHDLLKGTGKLISCGKQRASNRVTRLARHCQSIFLIHDKMVKSRIDSMDVVCPYYVDGQMDDFPISACMYQVRRLCGTEVANGKRVAVKRSVGKNEVIDYVKVPALASYMSDKVVM